VRSFLAGYGASVDDDHAFELRDGLVALSGVTLPPHVTVTDEASAAPSGPTTSTASTASQAAPEGGDAGGATERKPAGALSRAS
jgi:hypothetical protein